MKNAIILFFVQIIIGGLFYFINIMTPHPGQSSGNGNPAIIVMGVIVLLFIWSVLLWGRVLSNFDFPYKVYRIFIIFILLHWTFGVYFQRQSFLEYRELLSSIQQKNFGVVDLEYISQITSFMSIHVNNQYFNANTYLLCLSLSILIAILLRIILNRKKA
ncbi:hypothetical protein ACFYKX_03485 [Cytobacillus sp. FJAT-54145]|uniref:Uncharacterized protein n=1 Tax=Cytobacillus spartinae TaxID=3299023 RepID=A0ABW6KA53_9BACI